MISSGKFAIISAFIAALFNHAFGQQATRVRFDHPIQVAGNQHQPVALPDTVRVLAVMVEFQEDKEARTSGTGKFGTIYPFDYGGEILDPYPHNRAYFQAHARFLENYVRKASSGRTHVVGNVLDGIVTVSKPIRDYTFLKGQPEKPVANLAVEAWQLADAQFPSVDFSQYHMFVVFHAGRGRDIDLASITGSDPTPFDIPSLSFTLNGFKKHFGTDFRGIGVRGDSFFITNTSIVPTTNNREIPLITGQTALLELTINGLLAASFGTYAGLPDLFDTKSGRTGISRFGLMDAEGIFAYGGICPPAPSAWEKQFLGWTAPREATPGKREYLLTAQRTDQPSTADILRVPMTSKEYWLLENRQRDPGANGQRVTMNVSGNDIELRFPKDTTGFMNDDVSGLRGVIVDVEDLDWSLPGGTVVSESKEVRVNGGILIWHVDENIIGKNIADNTVNNNPDLRGVDLEQAGGPQDIGKLVPTVLGDQIGTGSPLDFWFRGNISPLYKNSFGPMTTPDSRANSGAWSHVTMDNFSSPGPLMSLDIAIGDNTIAPVEGFPIDLRTSTSMHHRQFFVQTSDLDGDGKHELICVSSHGITQSPSSLPDTTFVFVFREDGSSYLNEPIVARLPNIRWVHGSALVGDIDSDGISEIVVIGKTDDYLASVHIFDSRDGNADGLIDEKLVKQHASSGERIQFKNTNAVISGKGLVYSLEGLSADTLIVISGNVSSRPFPRSGSEARLGALATTPGSSNIVSASRNIFGYNLDQNEILQGRDVTSALTPALSVNVILTDCDGDGNTEAVSATPDLTVHHFAGDEKGVAELPVPVATGSLPVQSPVLASADADGDGRNDIVISLGDRLMVFNYALSSVDYYPLVRTAKSALAVRLQGAKQDAIFVVGEGELSQLTTRAKQAEGFPVPLPLDASVVLFPFGKNDPTLGIAAAGSDGYLYVFNTPNRVGQNSLVWRSMYADERNSNHAASLGAVDAPIAEFFPSERCYNWPNPTYEPTTKIRYYVSQSADIEIKIYDTAGEKVDEMKAKAIGGTDNEIEWLVSKMQSGVYLAHVKATAGSLSGEKIIKIAVVK